MIMLSLLKQAEARNINSKISPNPYFVRRTTPTRKELESVKLFLMWHDMWKPEEMITARQWFGKHVPVALNIHTTEKLLEVVFSMQSIPRLYNKDQWDKWIRNNVTGPAKSETKNDCTVKGKQKYTQNPKWVSRESTVRCRLALTASD